MATKRKRTNAALEVAAVAPLWSATAAAELRYERSLNVIEQLAKDEANRVLEAKLRLKSFEIHDQKSGLFDAVLRSEEAEKVARSLAAELERLADATLRLETVADAEREELKQTKAQFNAMKQVS